MHSLVQVWYRQVIQLINQYSPSVGSEHLREVLQYLEAQDITTRWKRIGVQLKLSYGDLDKIESNKASVEDCAMAMLYQWLISGRATKQALIDAVQVVK